MKRLSLKWGSYVVDQMKKKKIKINYETQYINGIKIVCKEWVPKDMVITVTPPDERGMQEVVIEKVLASK